MTGRGRLAFAALLAWAVAGCAAKTAPATGPFIVLAPAAAAPRPVPDSVASAPASAILRDTAALERQARRYVGRADSSPEVINQLSTLLLQTRSAVERMARNRTRAGYRATDIVAARVAADGLAAFLQTRTSASAASTPVPVAKAAPSVAAASAPSVASPREPLGSAGAAPSVAAAPSPTPSPTPAPPLSSPEAPAQ